ncbi:MAG: hypothetical protein HOB38_01615 [Deltaproteobacteria bacterium]|nr:hypothetical protein [Deltaproteobacteria bacterium]
MTSQQFSFFKRDPNSIYTRHFKIEHNQIKLTLTEKIKRFIKKIQTTGLS